MDDEQTGSCPTCARRDPHEPLICRVCRSKLRSWLGDIPALFAELQERIKEMAEPLEHRPYVAAMVEMEEGTKKRVVRTWREPTLRAADQVAYLMPAGGTSSPSRTGPVSGSKEPMLPINIDEVDLLGPPRGVSARSELADDATGYLSVASTLDFWVQDWRDARGGREGRPAPYVPALAAWLLRRADDAMDAHPAIEEMWNDVRQIHGALRAQLGLFDVPDYKRGVPCPGCSALTLVRFNGSEWVECVDTSCGNLLTPTQYDEHVASLANIYRRKNVTPAA